MSFWVQHSAVIESDQKYDLLVLIVTFCMIYLWSIDAIRADISSSLAGVSNFIDASRKTKVSCPEASWRLERATAL